MWIFFKIFLVGCVIFEESSSAKLEPLEWWQTTIFYQVYPRSFKDSNGDGIGDLIGIRQKLNYFKNLGVGAIWISPIFKSPMVDFGYDISDFTDIEPVFGTMNDFLQLMKEAKKKDIKVLIDFVPNHTSDQHPWFLKSVNKISPYTDYYVWKDGVIKNGTRHPPNNWISVFTGSAWTWNEKRQQYYYRVFTKQQPDLNYRNPKVIEEIFNGMRFWLDKGIDGIRLDAPGYMLEDTSFLDEPVRVLHREGCMSNEHCYLDHIYTLDIPENYELIYKLRDLLEEYTARDGKKRVILAESYAALDKKTLYYGNGTRNGAHICFNLLNFGRQSNAHEIVKIINDWEKSVPKGKWSNWVSGNHDFDRVSTRFDPEFVDAITMMTLLLPGTAVTYYGDELGMGNTFIRWDQVVDRIALVFGPVNYINHCRDAVRSPMQWNSSPGAGFSSNTQSWLPLNSNYYHKNVAMQRKDKKSHYSIYKRLARLRKTTTIQRGKLDLYALNDWMFCFIRSFGDHPSFIIVMNIGSDIDYADILSKRNTLPERLTVYAASANSNYNPGDLVSSDKIMLRPKEALTLTSADFSLVNSYILKHEEDIFNQTPMEGTFENFTESKSIEDFYENL